MRAAARGVSSGGPWQAQPLPRPGLGCTVCVELPPAQGPGAVHMDVSVQWGLATGTGDSDCRWGQAPRKVQ